MELRHAEKKTSWVKNGTMVTHFRHTIGCVMGINYLKSKRFVERQGIVAVCSFHVTRKGRPYTPAGVACPQCKQSKSTPATVFTTHRNISNKSGITACSSQLDATTILWICQNHHILSHFYGKFSLYIRLQSCIFI